MTDIYYGTFRASGSSFELRGFGTLELRGFSHICTPKKSQPRISEYFHVTPGDIIMPHYFALWDFRDFFLPLDHEPFLLECQVSDYRIIVACPP
jgi:hypothetical protein